MEYILSFLLYLVVNLLIALSVLFLAFLTKRILNKVFKKNIQIKKFNLIFVAFYFSFISTFYANKINDYLIDDRAYKEAKSYAITGDFINIFQLQILENFSADTILLKPFDYIQGIVLKNIKRNIPENDAEYEIWNYRFNLMKYALTMYAPVTKESKEKGYKFPSPKASMEEEIIGIIYSLLESMDNLDKKDMKDKDFKKLDKYLVISAMAPYYVEYFRYLSSRSIYSKGREYYDKKIDKFWTTKKYREQYERYLEILNNLNKDLKNNKELAKDFDKHPILKTSFYWGTVNGYLNYASIEIMRQDKYPCTNNNFLNFVRYYKDFTKWAYLDEKSSYNTLSKRQKRNSDFKIEDNPAGYYIAREICKIPFEYMVEKERGIPPKYRKRNFTRSMERAEGVKHTRKLKKDLERNKR